GRMRWTELTPPEWLSIDEQKRVPELKMTGSLQPFEKEYFRKDGSRVPVLLGVASLEEGENEGVAFVLDLTERKRAEAEARESERRYRKMQMALAHANCVATMGQLTASIAHEIKQPITASVANAQTALRWLGAHPPNQEEVREALDRIVKAGKRAGDIIDRIRALITKAPVQKDKLDINEVVGEVIALTGSDAVKNGVLVQTQFAQGLPLVQGDRVQLQQVVLNLVINAIEAMRDISEGALDLLVSTQKAERDDVLVAVSDT